MASELLVVVLTRTRRSTGAVQDRGTMQLLWVVIFSSIALGTWYGQTHGPNMGASLGWMRSVALCVLVAGLAIRWTAIVQLGKSFSVNVAIRADQTLHRTGLFAVVRHPSYTGMMLLFAAIGIRTGNWISIALLLIPTATAVLYRIHVEEAALTRAFGTEYAKYSRTTKRLIPGLY
jgi:protein-S-isoprenylcysteine O-methyltransferase Ste14